MSIENMTAKAGPFDCDGVQQAFPFEFNPLHSDYIAVYVNSSIVTGGYATTLNGSEGGTVTFDTPPESGAKVAIIRNVPPTQMMDLQNNTAFLPEVLETAYDKLTALVQQLQEVQERAFVVPPTSNADDAIRDAVLSIVSSYYGGGGGSINYAASAGSATRAGSATKATSATSAGWAKSAGSATSAGSANSAGRATSATSAAWASSCTSAVRCSSATSAVNASSAIKASSATSASYAVNAGSAVSGGYWGPFRASFGATYINGNTSSKVCVIEGGNVYFGGSAYNVGSSTQLLIPQEQAVYLVGTLGEDGPTFDYTLTEPSYAAGQFYVRIAGFSDGVGRQYQFGDISDTFPTGGGGTGDGVPFPKYHNLTYHTGGEGDEYTGGTDISNGNAYMSTSPGWVRVSIKNESGYSGCVQLVIGGASIGLVRLTSGMSGGTWLFPVPANTSFRVQNDTSSPLFARFDGEATQL